MQTIKGLTSIIIGCYNVGHWLQEKKLSCIRQQSRREIEIILVNDGSTDDTQQQLEALAKEDSRLRIITKENGGLGSARNAGLDAAKGEYIWFYDVDDEVDLQLVEKNVEWMGRYNTELNIFSIKITTLSQNLTEDLVFEKKLVESNEKLKEIFLDKLFLVKYGNGFAWNKFYRREILENNGIHFGNLRIQQDELFNMQIYPKINRVFVSSEPLYHYFIYEKGNARANYIPNRFSIYLSIYEGINRFANNWGITDKRLKDYAIRRLYDGISQSFLFNAFHPVAPFNKKEQRNEIMRIISHPMSQECIHYFQKHKFNGTEQRLYLWAFSHKSIFCIRLFRQSLGFLRKMKRFNKKN